SCFVMPFTCSTAGRRRPVARAVGMLPCAADGGPPTRNIASAVTDTALSAIIFDRMGPPSSAAADIDETRLGYPGTECSILPGCRVPKRWGGTLWDRVVRMPGGGGGIGRATGERFAAGGDTVVSADRSPEALAGLPGDAVVADVRLVPDCERMVEETVERHGRLDVLVNCAGVWVEGPTAEMTEEQWDRTVDVNLKGTFFACRFAIPHL